MVQNCINVRHSSIYVYISRKQSFYKIELRCDFNNEMHRAHVRYRKTTVLQQKNCVDFWISPVSTDAIVMDVRQRGQPRLWSCTASARDSQKRWWPHGTSAKRASRGATKHTSQESTASVGWHSRCRTGVVTGVGSSLRLCAVILILGVVVVVRVWLAITYHLVWADGVAYRT